MKYDNGRKITGVDAHKGVNIAVVNVPAVYMTNNNIIPGVDPKPSNW